MKGVNEAMRTLGTCLTLYTLIFTACLENPLPTRPKSAGTYQLKKETYYAHGNLKESRLLTSDIDGTHFSDTMKRSGIIRHDEIKKFENIGNNSKISFFDSNKKLKKYIIQEYDKAGKNLIKRSTYNASNALQSYMTYEYDKKNNLVKKTSFNNIHQRDGYEFEYGERGITIRSSLYGSGKLVSQNMNEFNSNANVVKQTKYNNLQIVESYKLFRYDFRWSLLVHEQFSGQNILIWRMVFDYDRKGRRVKLFFFENNPASTVDGVLTFYKTFDYNGKNRLVKVSTFNPDDTLAGYGTFEYDERGNKVKQVYHDSKGEIIGYSTYQYAFF